MHRYSLLLVALLGVASHAHASSWADGMFDELTRDFGSVPHGQTLMHPFRIVNNTKKPVHIANVRVSCGCVSARAIQTYLEPGQETAIMAYMDTNRFFNTKTVTIFVTFDQPHFEEVRLWVQANSRQDVTFSPNGIDYGRIKRGTAPDGKMTITFLGGNTEIVEVKSESNYVKPKLKQVQTSNGGTAFEIIATLRGDTPVGKWYTDIWVKTNNAAMPKLRIPVSVEVESALSVNPSSVSLGPVKSGTETDRKVIIRGIRPFKIVGITGTDKQLQVRTTNDESKTVHVLTVTLNPNEVGDLRRRITVRTDLSQGAEIEFEAMAKVEE